MPAKVSLSTLEEEERHARLRLAAYRAKLYGRSAVSAMAAEAKLHELERRWKGAEDRLRARRKIEARRHQR